MFHHLFSTKRSTRLKDSGGNSLVAMGEVEQVLHGHKGVAERLSGGDPLLRIDPQHPLQQAYKLSSVHLLCQQVTTFQIHHQVDLGERGRSGLRRTGHLLSFPVFVSISSGASGSFKPALQVKGDLFKGQTV